MKVRLIKRKVWLVRGMKVRLVRRIKMRLVRKKDVDSKDTVRRMKVR